MEKQKTINEWLETLPPGYRELALKNEKKYWVDCEYTSLAYSLHGAFVWNDTEEGHDFWKQVYDWAEFPDQFTLPALEISKTAEADSLREIIKELLDVIKEYVKVDEDANENLNTAFSLVGQTWTPSEDFVKLNNKAVAAVKKAEDELGK